MDELAGRRSHMRSRSLRACRCVPSWVVARRLLLQARARTALEASGGKSPKLRASRAPSLHARPPSMEPLQKQLSSASSSLPRERAKPPQIEAFKVAIDQVRLALEDDCTALTSSSVLQTLFTKSIGAAIHFNRSDSRLENDPEQGALFETIATIEEVVKTPSAEAALLKAGVVKAVPHLLSVLLSTEDDVECREAAVSCLIGAPRPAFAPRPARAPRPAGWPTHTRGGLVRQS